MLCAAVDDELNRARRVTELTGAGSYWAAAVALQDALTDYHAEDRRVWQAARSVGVSREQWAAVKRGG